MKSYEIEFRSLIDKEKFKELNSFLKDKGEYLGLDNKEMYFFLFPDKLLKVVKNTNSAKAKISLKMNRIGSGSDFEEIEVDILPEDTKKVIKIFNMLGLNSSQYVFQFRENYMFKGVTISTKYTESWGYHVELEILINDISKEDGAEKQIEEIASELGLEIMDEDHLKKFTSKIDSGWKRGKYAKEEFEQQLNE